jgi:hypothetical protein
VLFGGRAFYSGPITHHSKRLHTCADAGDLVDRHSKYFLHLMEDSERSKDRKAIRKDLKETRDELRRMLAHVDTAMGAQGSESSKAAPARGGSSSSSEATATLQLRPPILDPMHIVPPHMIVKFRQEFRAQQRDAPSAERASPAAAGGQSEDAAHALALSLEEFQDGLGMRARGPVDDKDYKSMVHGQSRRPFRSFPGAMSVASDQQVASPGKRTVPGSRASQSSLGDLLAGGASCCDSSKHATH